MQRPLRSTLFPYTTLFRSAPRKRRGAREIVEELRHPALTVGRGRGMPRPRPTVSAGDRKRTRLNSSHVSISYAVFCLKKKTNPAEPRSWPRGLLLPRRRET